jgi:hypothetical protein
MRNVLTWISAHLWSGAAYLFFVLILPGIVSAYSREIRFAISRGVGKPRKWGRAWKIEYLTHQLRTLEWLHNSAYNLLLHLAWNAVWVLRLSIGYSFAVSFIIMAFTWRHPAGTIPLPVFLPTLACLTFGRSLALMDTFNGLYRYDERVAYMKAEIQRLESAS